MKNEFDYNSWRDVVNSTEVDLESYNKTSLADYIDYLRQAYHDELIGVDQLNEQERVSFVHELAELFSDYLEQVDDLDRIYISGNGVYYPEATSTVEFIDGTAGVSGEYSDIAIIDLPAYQDLIDGRGGDRLVPQLCLVLSNYAAYSDSRIELEPSDSSVIVPLEGQDMCFSRVDHGGGVAMLQQDSGVSPRLG